MSVSWSGARAAAVLLAVLWMPACGDDGNPTMDTGADDGTSSSAGTGTDASTSVADASTSMSQTAPCTDELPQLHVINQTGNAVEEIIMLACDMSDESSFPVPPGGLPTGGELTIPLPGPGCWVLQYNGEGCFADTPGMVEAAACETVEWMLGEDNHVCAGG